MKAKDITDCEDCPLKEKCKGMTSSPSGVPIEPVCLSWDDEDEISLDRYNHAIIE